MNADLRASLLVGAAAAGLSLLVGILAGIPFLALVVRALLFALLFGGLAWGAGQLLRSFLPELFEARSGSPESPPETDAEEPESVLGGAVDIVLDDSEDGQLRAAPMEAGAELGEEPLLEAEPSLLGERGRGPEPAYAETVDEPRPAAALPSRPSPGLDELDMLPDLEAFSGSFGALDIGPPSSGEATPSPPSYGGGETASGRGSPAGPGGADPATLAMAVRTLLKRDQKG